MSNLRFKNTQIMLGEQVFIKIHKIEEISVGYVW